MTCESAAETASPSVAGRLRRHGGQGLTDPRALAAALLAALALIGPRPSSAGHGAPPGSITTLSLDFVKRLIEAGEPLVLVDLRKPDEYQAGHLPGAISLPITELEGRFREIPQRGRVVLYCQCPSEDLIAVFLFLRSQGYSNHATLDEGFGGWLRRKYPVAK